MRSWTLKRQKKSVAEFECGSMIEPFDRLEDVPVAAPRLLVRFPIREKNGGALEWKVRLIDDCKLGGQNLRAGATACHRPADLDFWVAMLRVYGGNFAEAMAAFTSDFRAAYRQVPSCPLQAESFVVATYDPVRKVVVFGLAVAQLFGSSLAPLNFSRYPAVLAEYVAVLFAILFVQCVDDLLSSEA